MTRRLNKAPTWTSLVEQALIEADDFMSLDQIEMAIGASLNQATAALHHLQHHRAVDAVEGGGRLWWFATPADDNRLRKVHERVPEEPGTRKRRRKAA